ncbi:MAG: hypothetical protein NVS1B3_14100 [Candidatus Dormibacteraceae bacterium]
MGVMEDRRPVEPAQSKLQETPLPMKEGESSRRPVGSLVAPAVAILAAVCCAGPILVAALAASGAGVWLAAQGYTVGAATLILLAAILAWWIRRLTSRSEPE